jgi:uncharacterized membrane protein YdbT with pleckstrin-like domain
MNRRSENASSQRFKDAAAEARSADEPEEDLWSGGFSGKAMYGSWMLAGIASIGLAAVCFFGVLKQPTGTYVFAIAMLFIWGGLGLLLAYRKLSVHYQLTSQRFVHKDGILVRRTDRIELIDVDDVTFVQGLIQRLFNVGTIRISSSDRSHPELMLIGIADVERVCNLVDDARRKERRRRGLHIESI